MNPYGNELTVVKSGCIGHVEKRLGCRLRKRNYVYLLSYFSNKRRAESWKLPDWSRELVKVSESYRFKKRSKTKILLHYLVTRLNSIFYQFIKICPEVIYLKDAWVAIFRMLMKVLTRQFVNYFQSTYILD